MTDLVILNKESVAESGRSIGGVPVGCQDLGGVYAGYVMVGGDNFDGPLDIVHAGNPNGKYYTTRGYSNGCRSAGGQGHYDYSMDQYHTGSQDSNRGVAIGSFDLVQQHNSSLTVRCREANASELPYINGRVLASSCVLTNGYIVACAPCIIEYSAALSPTATNPQGMHPTVWSLSADGVQTAPSLEFDWPECSSQNIAANVNTIGPPTGWSTTGSSEFTGYMGNGFHTYGQILTSSSALLTVDGVTKYTQLHDATITNRPFYFLFTNHTFDASYNGDPDVNLAEWAAQGQFGAWMSVDWYRVWVPTASAIPVVTPQVALPVQQYNYGQSITYTFPPVASLWPSGVTDYCQALKIEDFEPGCNVEDTQTYYTQFPSGMTWNSTTRVLSGLPTANKPGRLHLASIPFLSGSLGYVARGYIDIGPNMLLTDFVLVNGVAASVDLYYVCDCGTLVEKAVTVTGLPSGLTFNPSTCVITGTPTVNASTPITVTVTNSSGQTATVTVNLIVQAAADALTIDTSVTTTAASATISTTKARDVLVAVFHTSPAANCLGITSTSGLNWIRRGALSNLAGNFNIEVWYARTNGILTNEVITPHNTGSRLTVFAVNGVNMVTPFDPNPSLINGGFCQGVTGTTGTSLGITISTNNANTLVFTDVRSLASLGTITEPTGFSQIVGTGTSEDISYKVNSSALSNVTETYSWTGATTESLMIIDALQGQA